MILGASLVPGIAVRAATPDPATPKPKPKATATAAPTPAPALTAAPLPISDDNCPFAVLAAKGFIRTTAQTPGDSEALVKSSLAAATAYASCAKQLTKDRETVPAFLAKFHHAEVREAQYHLVAGRNYFILGDGGNAREQFERARALSSDVANWAPPPSAPTENDAIKPRIISRYHEAAVLVLDQAAAASRALDEAFAQQLSSPQASGSPSPAPTATPMPRATTPAHEASAH